MNKPEHVPGGRAQGSLYSEGPCLGAARARAGGGRVVPVR